jgi:NAD(P)-dependent dehydrogenase (short-subunit alcohol dehydrogenase family)
MPHAYVATWVRPEQIATAIAFLLGDDASAVTGAALPVRGAG